MAESTGRGFWREAAQTLMATLLVAGIVSAASFIVSKAATAHFKSLQQHGFVLGAGLFCIFSLGAWAVWRRADKFRPHYPRLHCRYRIIEKEITYRYLSRTELRYTKTVRLKALQDIETFHDKYNWTGQGEIRLSSMVPEHRIVELGTRNIWRIYEVHLGRSLRKGDEVEVAIRWDLKDFRHTARPFISQTVEAPTTLLRFKLEVPEDFGVTRAQLTVLPSIEALSSIEDADAPVRNGAVEWTIKRPKLLHCYQVSWYDPGADATPPIATEVATSVGIPGDFSSVASTSTENTDNKDESQ